jgi:hypothetical protein
MGRLRKNVVRRVHRFAVNIEKNLLGRARKSAPAVGHPLFGGFRPSGHSTSAQGFCSIVMREGCMNQLPLADVDRPIVRRDKITGGVRVRCNRPNHSHKTSPKS